MLNVFCLSDVADIIHVLVNDVIDLFDLLMNSDINDLWNDYLQMGVDWS